MAGMETHGAPTFAEATDISDVADRLRSARRSAAILKAVSILLLVAAIAIIGYPFALQAKSAHELAGQTAQTAERVEGWPYPEAEEALQAAHAYNNRLAASGQPVLGEASDPFVSRAGGSHASGDEDSASAKDAEYQSLLDAGGGVMGAIRVPRVSIDLPIYHGTSAAALASGSGHLYGTSLPVGGPSTHSVITGHRGLVEAMMFTRLDELRRGDVFYIEVMGETLAYRVDRITVIEPDDTSQLRIVPGEDRVTLMTCTPYGINTHRLLVSGLRARIPQDAPDPADAPGDGIVPAIATGLGVLVVGWVAVRVATGRRWRVVRHVTAWPRRW